MAYAGQTIENPVSGERITFIRTAADTDGELLEIELELSPDGAVPGAHVHPEQEERFEVQVRPALAMEELFETTVALAEDGRTTAKGMPRPLDLALFVREFQREVRAPFPPPRWSGRCSPRSHGGPPAAATA